MHPSFFFERIKSVNICQFALLLLEKTTKSINWRSKPLLETECDSSKKRYRNITIIVESEKKLELEMQMMELLREEQFYYPCVGGQGVKHAWPLPTHTHTHPHTHEMQTAYTESFTSSLFHFPHTKSAFYSWMKLRTACMCVLPPRGHRRELHTLQWAHLVLCCEEQKTRGLQDVNVFNTFTHVSALLVSMVALLCS